MTRRTDTILDTALRVLLLGALPPALWLLGGNPIPRHLPSSLDVHMWCSAVQTHPAAVLGIVPWVILDALWIGWAWYGAWTVVGIGWNLLHLPGLWLPRILLRLTPRTTVQALTVGAVAISPIAHATPAAHHTGATALPADLNGRLHLTAAARSPRTGFPFSFAQHPGFNDAPIHTVVEGDTLWDLAQHYYGDAEQWRRIFARNMLRPQPHGGQLTNPDRILPGWTLLIPHHPDT
ncbi:MAG: LysM peptidoglycan-binding domain-containing protein, partial [Sciscionella sp.]